MTRLSSGFACFTLSAIAVLLAAPSASYADGVVGAILRLSSRSQPFMAASRVSQRDPRTPYASGARLGRISPLRLEKAGAETRKFRRP